MATATLQQLVLGAFSSVSEASGRPRYTRRCSYPRFRCRGRQQASTQSGDCHRLNLSSSCGRRSLTFMAAIPFLFPLHHLVEAADASELSIIRNVVMKVLSKSKAAGMLRLAFHDAGTFDTYDGSGGMNGSIVYELDRPENAGLNKSIKILDKAKMELDEIRQVSWADLIAVAGAEAVSLCGGPTMPLRLGRLDARKPDPEGKLPQESLDASGLKRCFLRKGFSMSRISKKADPGFVQVITLNSQREHKNLLHYVEHTLLEVKVLGVRMFLTIHSSEYFLRNRGHLQLFRYIMGETSLMDAYLMIGQGGFITPINWNKTLTVNAGMSNMIGLPSDRALVEDDECLRWIKIYADDEVTFFEDFKSAYIKLVNNGVHWRSI